LPEQEKRIRLAPCAIPPAALMHIFVAPMERIVPSAERSHLWFTSLVGEAHDQVMIGSLSFRSAECASRHREGVPWSRIELSVAS